MLGLGGSAFLKVAHATKSGTPPRCDLEKEKELHEALLALIYSGEIKSAHDCSEGGLAVTLAECCFSHQTARDTFQLTGASVDLSSVSDVRLDALLFGESQGRVLVSVSALNAVKVIERARILGVTALNLGVTGGTALNIRTEAGEWSWDLRELHRLWWNAIAEAMRI